jgi:hypothetical protein
MLTMNNELEPADGKTDKSFAGSFGASFFSKMPHGA